MEKQLNMHRNEIKYFINKRQAVELKLFLRRNLNLDQNADEKCSYWIRSLYFDTIDNRDYYEKIIGHNIRKKIRLRIYDIHSTIVKLEIKNKFGGYIFKETVAISRKDADKLTYGDCSSLLSYNEQVSNKVYALMHRNLYRPTVIIEYEREAYLYPFENIRVTLDKNLCATFNSRDFFKEDTSMIPIFNKDVLILEVKYNHMIPVHLQRVLSNFTLQRSQISKYCLGRNRLGK